VPSEDSGYEIIFGYADSSMKLRISLNISKFINCAKLCRQIVRCTQD